MLRRHSLLACWIILAMSPSAWSQQPAIPHAQDKPPNEPRDAETAAKMMTVPEGFVVDVVAAEPDIVNPVAMTFDEKGRVWITESLEYPRKEPGPGKDRVKILEDTDGDGAMDKFSIFLDGLNIPSGVAVGHGGVWIANSPDILFVPDKDRDGKPDGEAEVVVTGFGRTDTHELPNSLTWGPDGWLYGLNGVFNHSHVKYPEGNPNYKPDHPGWPLTCAMFRIHPRTREFQVFAEGTSNPWGIAFNDEGDAFVSACVIDHLWHIVETGYYHRQGGPYPPHTWKIGSIVEHKHQKAAYCGITWFDSDAYPEPYRRKLYMGNIHGGCINVDRLERNGSTYKGFGEPDFLTANDAWFMPVVQKTGPDGCLWILDWYDRYHCYQDANRDPAGIDRLKGRLYRVRYVGAGSVSDGPLPRFDLAAESDDQLIQKLGHPNVWMRETAQRLLQERDPIDFESKLCDIIEENGHLALRRHAWWALHGSLIGAIEPGNDNVERISRIFHAAAHPKDPVIFADQIRLSDELPRFPAELDSPGGYPFEWLTKGIEPQILLQHAISFGKFEDDSQAIKGLIVILSLAEEDVLLPHIVWQNLHPRLEDHSTELLKLLESDPKLRNQNSVVSLLPRIADRILARQKYEPELIARLLKLALERESAHAAAGQILKNIAQKIETGELASDKLDGLRAAINPVIQPLIQNQDDHALKWHASLLALSWKDQSAVGAARTLALNPKENADRRVAALNALIAAKADGVVDIVASVLHSESEISNLKSQILQSASRLDDPKVAEIVITDYAALPAELQPRAVELLTQRATWAKSLLAAVGAKKLSADVINLNQARRLHELKDEELSKLLKDHWGEIRDGRNPDRERIVAEMKTYIREHKGDELNGAKVYQKVCGQCHKLYGEGAEVGPDITRIGRNDYQQLLSNVFDPSLVIGAGYRSYTVATTDGRVINGLLIEESPQRIVLKVQGGKQEIIPAGDIDEFKVSELSLMPEQLEKQITPAEIADLFAYITLDKPPSDPEAKRLAGVYEIVPRETANPTEFAAIFQEVAPGFAAVTSGEGGVGLLAEHRGRKGVVRTHPVSRDKAAIMHGKFAIPPDMKTTLVIEVSHDERGDWRLLAGGQGERLLDEIVGKDTCPDGWARFEIDLSKFAGKEIELELRNQANNWSWEYGYWGSVRIVSE